MPFFYAEVVSNFISLVRQRLKKLPALPPTPMKKVAPQASNTAKRWNWTGALAYESKANQVAAVERILADDLPMLRLTGIVIYSNSQTRPSFRTFKN